jgi:hypothetical protein
MKFCIALALPMFLIGCTDTSSTGDTSNTTGCTDTGGCTTDTSDTFDAGSDITLDWERVDTNGSVAIDVVNSGATGFYLGMAETASGDNGWYGEDCADQGDCHHFVATSGSLDYVETINAVTPGSTTLFDGGSDGGGDAFTSDGADRLTYLFQLEGGSMDGQCYIWGDDTSYYSGEGCTAL